MEAKFPVRDGMSQYKVQACDADWSCVIMKDPSLIFSFISFFKEFSRVQGRFKGDKSVSSNMLDWDPKWSPSTTFYPPFPSTCQVDHCSCMKHLCQYSDPFCSWRPGQSFTDSQFGPWKDIYANYHGNGIKF